MGSDPLALRLLDGLGLDEISLHSAAIVLTRAALSRINSVAATFFEKKPALRHKSCCGVFFTGTAARQTAAGFSGALTVARAW